MPQSKVIVTCLFVIAIAASLIAQAADEQSVAGRWEGQRAAEGRLDQMAFVFNVTAKGITGTAFYNGQEFAPIDAVVVKGRTIAFDTAGMSFTGTLDDKAGTIKLTAHFDGRDLWDLTVTKKAK